jgi:hypothetical protein
MPTAEAVRLNTTHLLDRCLVTAYQASRQAGKHRSWLSDIIGGRRRTMTAETIDTIAALFEVDPWILADPEFRYERGCYSPPEWTQ